MSKQKHDLGNKKRRAAAKAAETPGHFSTEALAQKLVLRGLASHLILESRIATSKEPRQ